MKLAEHPTVRRFHENPDQQPAAPAITLPLSPAEEGAGMPFPFSGNGFEPKVLTPGSLPGQAFVPPPPAPAFNVPRVIPVEALPDQNPPPAPVRPKVIQLQRDASGLIPGRPPGPPPRRPNSFRLPRRPA